MIIEVERPPKTALEAFRMLPEGTYCQLINNVILMSPAPKTIHQQVLQELNRALDDFVYKKKLGIVLFAPVDVYLNDENAFQPDLIFISNENLSRLQDDGFYGAPDLVIEILSPSNKKIDQADKKLVYESCGVKEYWIVDPQTKSCEGFVLQNKKFTPQGSFTAQIQSKLLSHHFSF